MDCVAVTEEILLYASEFIDDTRLLEDEIFDRNDLVPVLENGNAVPACW